MIRAASFVYCEGGSDAQIGIFGTALSVLIATPADQRSGRRLWPFANVSDATAAGSS